VRRYDKTVPSLAVRRRDGRRRAGIAVVCALTVVAAMLAGWNAARLIPRAHAPARPAVATVTPQVAPPAASEVSSANPVSSDSAPQASTSATSPPHGNVPHPARRKDHHPSTVQ
jgi:hypothetical protein